MPAQIESWTTMASNFVNISPQTFPIHRSPSRGPGDLAPREKRVVIFWDLFTCPIPKMLRPEQVCRVVFCLF